MKHEEVIPKSEILVEILDSIIVKYSISLSGEYEEITPDNLQKILNIIFVLENCGMASRG